MQPADIANGYDQIAHLWEAESLREYGTAQHVWALAFVEDGQSALDVGCGPGRMVDLLLKHGFTVEGVDISPRMIHAARARHPQVTFHLADICQWELPRRYDFISAWDSLWHVPLARQEAVLRRLLRGLAPGGVMIFSAGGLDAPGEKVDSSMGPPLYYSTLGIPKLIRVILEEGCLLRHFEYDQLPESHLCVIVQRPKAEER